MLDYKKTIIVLLHTITISTSFAGTMGSECTAESAKLPCEHKAWDFGLQALYLKPYFSNFIYDGAQFSNNNTTETFGKLPYEWNWGIRLEGSYHFNHTNDLKVNWFHYDHTSHEYTTKLTVPISVQGKTSIIVVDELKRISQPRWNAINIEFGQTAQFGSRNHTRFHRGLQFASISTVGAGTGLLEPDLSPVSGQNKLSYWGLGPRLGLDYEYSLSHHLSVYGKGAGAILAGPQGFVQNIFDTKMGKTCSIVPEIEIKLGATYGYDIAQGYLNLDIGWMWVDYFQALTGYALTGLGTTTQTNFAATGPFIGLKWMGNIA